MCASVKCNSRLFRQSHVRLGVVGHHHLDSQGVSRGRGYPVKGITAAKERQGACPDVQGNTLHVSIQDFTDTFKIHVAITVITQRRNVLKHPTIIRGLNHQGHGEAAIARILERGDKRDPREIFKLHSQACEGNVVQACYEVGKAWEAARDPVRALPFYKKACEGEIAAACTRVRRLER